MPGSLPAEVKQKWDEVQKQSPKLRNAMVNALVPKSVTYADSLNVQESTLQRFIDTFVEHQHSWHCTGQTYSDLQNEWGGDELGARRIQDALDRGDRVWHEGMLYKRSHNMTTTKSKRESHKAQKDASLEVTGWMFGKHI